MINCEMYVSCHRRNFEQRMPPGYSLRHFFTTSAWCRYHAKCIGIVPFMSTICGVAMPASASDTATSFGLGDDGLPCRGIQFLLIDFFEQIVIDIDGER
jgi:hypothetical protein